MLLGRLGHGFWITSCADCNLFNVEWLGWQWMEEHHIITARKRSLGQGNVFTCVCYSVHGEGVSVWCHFLSGCLVPCSFEGVSVSGSMLLPRGSLSLVLCSFQGRAFISTRPLVHKHVKISVGKWLLDITWKFWKIFFPLHIFNYFSATVVYIWKLCSIFSRFVIWNKVIIVFTCFTFP